MDLDEEIEKTAGKSIPAIFSEDGEPAFRDLEAQVLAAFAKRSSLMLATGGGAVLRAENRRRLRENGVVLHLTRPLDRLATDGRPLSRINTAEALWNARKDSYRAAADAELPVSDDPAVTLSEALKWWEGVRGELRA